MQQHKGFISAVGFIFTNDGIWTNLKYSFLVHLHMYILYKVDFVLTFLSGIQVYKDGEGRYFGYDCSISETEMFWKLSRWVISLYICFFLS